MKSTLDANFQYLIDSDILCNKHILVSVKYYLIFNKIKEFF